MEGSRRRWGTAVKAVRLLLLSLAFGHTQALAEPTGLSISDVQIDRRQFHPVKGEFVTVRFRLNQPAQVELRWFDPRDLCIRTIPSARPMPTGESSMIWDGRDQAGRVVPDEAYHYTITATSADGVAQEFDLTELSGGEDREIPNVTLDATARELRYTVSNWSRVNIRIGINDNGPLLRSLLNWRVRGPGQHIEPWDGYDESGVLDLANSQGLHFWGMAFSLPDNSVIVGDALRSSSVIDDLSWGRVPRVVKRHPLKRMHAHSQQSYEQRGDFEVVLRPRGTPVAKGVEPVPLKIPSVTPFEVVVQSAIAQRLAEQRFEVVYFVDGRFIGESEIGVLPTTWSVDSVALTPGEHFLTVNLRSYEGSFGYGSIRVHVLDERQSDDKVTVQNGVSP